jgi:hypothetical protein
VGGFGEDAAEHAVELVAAGVEGAVAAGKEVEVAEDVE